MAQVEAPRAGTAQHMLLDGRDVEWRLVRSAKARKLRIKVGPEGVVVVVPEGRESRDAEAFVAEHHAWVAEQLDRARALLVVRRPVVQHQGRMPFRGESLAIRVVRAEHWRGQNHVSLAAGAITITCGSGTAKSASRTLENWLRKQAREAIERQLEELGKRMKRTPNRLYVMGQRTKWGNCSGLGNLSFNWRLIMAPDFVLHYIVTHEMVHLVVPDHSRKFWLTVQSLCPETERARRWLVANGERLHAIDLSLIGP